MGFQAGFSALYIWVLDILHINLMQDIWLVLYIKEGVFQACPRLFASESDRIIRSYFKSRAYLKDFSLLIYSFLASLF